VLEGEDHSALPPASVLETLSLTIDVEVDVDVPEGPPLRALSVAAGMTAPEGAALLGLRQLHGRVAERDFRLAGRALQLLEWVATHRFCGRCGAATERHAEYRALACGACGQMHFPRVAPAVIVLVEREGAMLLGRSARFAPGVYSALAGFVEPGESLEEAVEREVLEEAGVEIRDVRYSGSQPWPFPHSLMIAYTARWAGGEPLPRDGELEDVRWFDAGGPLPELPAPISIARRLIDDFLERRR
jgi:NAD+ diphosphatase